MLARDPRFLGNIWPSEGKLSGYAVSPDGAYVVTKTTAGLVELRDAGSGRVVASRQEGPTGVFSSTLFLPGGQSFVSGGYDAAKLEADVVILSAPALAEVRRFHTSSVTVALMGGLSGDGARFGMMINGVAYAFNLEDGTRDAIPGLPGVLNAPVFDPLGRYLAVQTIEKPGTVSVFDAESYRLVRTLPLAFSGLVPAPILFTPDGNLLLANYGPGSDPGSVELWNPASGQRLASAPAAQTPGNLSLDSSGTRVAFTKPDGAPGVYALPDLTPVSPPLVKNGASYGVPSFADGNQTLYNLNVNGRLGHWDLGGSGLVTSYTAATGPGESALAPDGTWLLKQTPDGNWSRWSVPALALIDRSASPVGVAPTPGSGSLPLAPAISGDGRYFATAHTDCPRPDQVVCGSTVTIWDAGTGRPFGEPIHVARGLGLRQRAPVLLGFHPDLPLLAIAGPNNAVEVWSIDGARARLKSSFITRNAGNTNVTAMAFLPAKAAQVPTLVTLAGGYLALWDVTTAGGSQVGLYDSLASTRGMAVTPSGEIALLRMSGDLEFFRAEAFASAAEPQPRFVTSAFQPTNAGTSAGLAALTFSADGRLVAWRELQGRVVVWDLQRSERLGASFAATGPGTALLAPDSSFLVVTGDSAALLWRLDAKVWAEKACVAAGRNLSDAEWAKYFPGRNYEVTCPQWTAKPKT